MKNKWLIYHFHKGLVYFDKIVSSKERAQEWIKEHEDQKRNFMYEEVGTEE